MNVHQERLYLGLQRWGANKDGYATTVQGCEIMYANHAIAAHNAALDHLDKIASDNFIRLEERQIMCDKKDEAIKHLIRRVHSFRQAIWEHLIFPGDDGCTASGYSQDDIPDELLYDAIVDALAGFSKKV